MASENFSQTATAIHNSPGAHHKKPIRLRNIASKAEAFDCLHIRPCEVSKMLKEFLLCYINAVIKSSIVINEKRTINGNK